MRDVVGGQCIVFIRKPVVDELFLRKSINVCISTVGIDASHPYHYSMCQHMPTSLNTRWDIDSETSTPTPRQNKASSFENMVMSFFNEQDLTVKMRDSTLQAVRRKMNASVVMGFVVIAILCFRQCLASNTFVPVKNCVHLSPKKTSNVEVRKGRSMN